MRGIIAHPDCEADEFECVDNEHYGKLCHTVLQCNRGGVVRDLRKAVGEP